VAGVVMADEDGAAIEPATVFVELAGEPARSDLVADDERQDDDDAGPAGQEALRRH
jgi:hypothetical protein